MRVMSRVGGIALLWMVVLFVPAMAQEAQTVDARSTVQMSEDTDRAALSDFLTRPEVETAARIGGVDLDAVQQGLPRLEGDQLHRAAEQARAIDRQLGERDAQGEIRIQTVTLIIILLLVIIVILLV